MYRASGIYKNTIANFLSALKWITSSTKQEVCVSSVKTSTRTGFGQDFFFRKKKWVVFLFIFMGEG